MVARVVKAVLEDAAFFGLPAWIPFLNVVEGRVPRSQPPREIFVNDTCRLVLNPPKQLSFTREQLQNLDLSTDQQSDSLIGFGAVLDQVVRQRLKWSAHDQDTRSKSRSLKLRSFCSSLHNALCTCSLYASSFKQAAIVAYIRSGVSSLGSTNGILYFIKPVSSAKNPSFG